MGHSEPFVFGARLFDSSPLVSLRSAGSRPPPDGFPFGIVDLTPRAETEEIVPAILASPRMGTESHPKATEHACRMLLEGAHGEVAAPALRASRPKNLVPSPGIRAKASSAVATPQGTDADPSQQAFTPVPAVGVAEMGAAAQRAPKHSSFRSRNRSILSHQRVYRSSWGLAC